MNWYRVKIQTSAGNPPWCRHVQAVDETSVWRVMSSQSYDVLSVKLDKQWGPSLERKDYWRNIWSRALAAMPKRVRHVKTTYMDITGVHTETHPAEYGHYAALARCLGMRINRFTHKHIVTALHHGYRPKDDKRRERLLKLAGPYGSVLARLKLTQMGIAKRYAIWPE